MPTWMVVEDEPDIYDVLLAMFEIWGIEGVAFVDGAEAVSWIDDVDAGRVRGELPELAILDIRLPEVSGPELGERLRKSPVLGNSAIILITAYKLTENEEKQVIEQAQADLLMYKPLPAMPELRRTMDNVISKRKQLKAAAQAAHVATEKEGAKPVASSSRSPAASSPAISPLPRVAPADKPKADAPPPPPKAEKPGASSSNGKSAPNASS